MVFRFSLIMEGATEKVSKSIMPMKTNYNKIFSFNEQKYFEHFRKVKTNIIFIMRGNQLPVLLQVAVCNFYLVKNHKIANNSMITED
jgi:hypothetical protein